RRVAIFPEIDDLPATERKDMGPLALNRPVRRLGLAAFVAQDDDAITLDDELARCKLLEGQLVRDRLEKLRHLLAAAAGAEEGQPGRPLDRPSYLRCQSPEDGLDV